MTDREKYIEVLSKTVKTVKACNDYAPIKISLECVEDILELLKEQEAVEPTWSRGKPFCGACGLRTHDGKFCSECGKPIAWEGR